MKEKETIKLISDNICDVMVPMYSELTELREKLVSLSTNDSAYAEINAKFQALYNRYMFLYNANKSVANSNGVQDLKSVEENITKRRDELFSKYNDLKNKYNAAVSAKKPIKEINKIVDEVNELMPELVSLNDLLNKIRGNMRSLTSMDKKIDRPVNKEVPKANVTPTRQEPKPEVKPEVKPAEKPTEKVTPAPVKPTNGPKKKGTTFDQTTMHYLSNPATKDICMCNLKIQKLKEELYKSNPGSKRYKEITQIIYDLCEEREKFVVDILGPQAVNKLAVIESKEDAAYSKANIAPFESHYVDSEEFSTELSSTIQILGDLKFNGMDSEVFKEFREREESIAKRNSIAYEETMTQTYKKLYESTVRSYRNLVGSVIGNDKELGSMRDDLLASLSSFNLTGGYAAFKRKHKDGKVGGSAISKDVYLEGVDKIKGLIGTLGTYASKYIASKGGKVEVVDREKTRQQIISEVNTECFGLLDQVVQAKKVQMSSSRA